MRNREQQLVDLCFSIGLTISDPKNRLINLSTGKKAKWIAEQLEDCGFPTTPIGMSWGVLDK